MDTIGAGASKEHTSWAHDHAVIRLYRDFESLMLQALVGAINNDTGTISKRTGIDFPKHLTDEVCEYLIAGSGYFDFRGRDGLIKQIKSFVPDDHYLVDVVKKRKYKEPLERLIALRNFAAHDSAISKAKALEAVGLQRMGSAGSWLKVKHRFGDLVAKLKELAQEVEAAAPY